MKKFLSQIAMVFISACAIAQTPEVSIQIDEVTPTSIKATFTPNEVCSDYYVFAVDTSEIDMFEHITGKTINLLVQEWGKTKYSGKMQYTWTEMAPNVSYAVYALAIDSTNTNIRKVLCTTPKLGGKGVALQNIKVSEITSNSARVVVTPNRETSVYYIGLIKKETFDEIGVDSATNIILKHNRMYPKYETDNWVWSSLESDTEWIALTTSENINKEKGISTYVKFKTLADPMLTTYSNIDVSVFPNPAKDNIYVSCPDMTKLEMYDGFGKRVISQSLSDDKAEINVAYFSEGTYLLLVQSLKGIAVVKVMVVS